MPPAATPAEPAARDAVAGPSTGGGPAPGPTGGTQPQLALTTATTAPTATTGAMRSRLRTRLGGAPTPSVTSADATSTAVTFTSPGPTAARIARSSGACQAGVDRASSSGGGSNRPAGSSPAKGANACWSRPHPPRRASSVTGRGTTLPALRSCRRMSSHGAFSDVAHGPRSSDGVPTAESAARTRQEWLTASPAG